MQRLWRNDHRNDERKEKKNDCTRTGEKFYCKRKRKNIEDHKRYFDKNWSWITACFKKDHCIKKKNKVYLYTLASFTIEK